MNVTPSLAVPDGWLVVTTWAVVLLGLGAAAGWYADRRIERRRGARTRHRIAARTAPIAQPAAPAPATFADPTRHG